MLMLVPMLVMLLSLMQMPRLLPLVPVPLLLLLPMQMPRPGEAPPSPWVSSVCPCL